MHAFLRTVSIAGVMLLFAGRAAAQQDARAIVAKAVQAAGGMEKLKLLNAMRVTSRGNLEVKGGIFAVTSTGAFQFPDRYRAEIELDRQGQKATIVQVVDGDRAWIRTTDQVRDLSAPEAKEMIEMVYGHRVETLAPLLTDKSFTLTALGERKVVKRPAHLVRVAGKGHRDIDLFFDKETGLLVKSQRVTLENGGQETVRESYYGAYKEVQGVLRPMKVVVYHNGKKFLDGEVSEIRFLARIADGEFAKP